MFADNEVLPAATMTVIYGSIGLGNEECSLCAHYYGFRSAATQLDHVQGLFMHSVQDDPIVSDDRSV